MSLGEAIRTARQKSLYTQEDFAKCLGVSLSTVNRWELNKSQPSMKAMKSIREFCSETKQPYELIESEWMRSKSSGE